MKTSKPQKVVIKSLSIGRKVNQQQREISLVAPKINILLEFFFDFVINCCLDVNSLWRYILSPHRISLLVIKKAYNLFHIVIIDCFEYNKSLPYFAVNKFVIDTIIYC